MAENSFSTEATVQSPLKVKGPLVWLDMDQKELDDAYDQSVYAPNQQLVAARRRLVVIPWQMALVSVLLRLAPPWLYDRFAARAPRKPRDLRL